MRAKKVALVEKELLGGTCTNYGCDAKILLDSPFELKEALDRKKNPHLVGAAVFREDAGVYIDMITLIINKKLGVRDLGKMIFAFPTVTYGLI